MTKQVLIINITRMGDLVQTIPLLGRLMHEWPGVQIDLVVDKTFAAMAALLPGVRHVLAYDFQGLINESRVMGKDVVTLYREMSSWAKPLADAHYDRVINLTFNRRSGLLTAYIGASDIRGVTTAHDGASVLHNPWFNYFVDMHEHRRFNRFNLVDIYALGGSGPGPHTSLQLSRTKAAIEWAQQFLHIGKGNTTVIAVQIGASEAIKAWRPESFGRTMAAISRLTPVMFVLIGTPSESGAVHEAIAAYRNAAGRATLLDAVGKTDLPRLAAVLAQCRLLLTNDTGPMHVAVGVGTPVIDLSVGHVDFNETGPYGPGHWVVQPDLGCAPCGFDQVCPHHACKDRLVPQQMAELCLHVLGLGLFSTHVTGVRLYESAIDEDGLACYRLRAGHVDTVSKWYGTFWRTYWYETFTHSRSQMSIEEPAPDLTDQQHLFQKLTPVVGHLLTRTAEVARLSRRRPIPVERLQSTQAELALLRRQVLEMTMSSSAFGPITVALLRELGNGDAMELSAMAQEQARAYRIWAQRLRGVMDYLDTSQGLSAQGRARPLSERIPLLMP
ncbi:MAG TPA: glycosyltransferase family 9 protein [Nitrospiraceae bacterium]|nr:glycosyltransferase family 9 protein [Nitrospiraceae bacterium]